MNDDLVSALKKLDDNNYRLNNIRQNVDQCFWEFWNLVLAGNHGVSEQAYRKLYELAGLINKAKNDELCMNVAACDGKFYLKG